MAGIDEYDLDKEVPAVSVKVILNLYGLRHIPVAKD